MPPRRVGVALRVQCGAQAARWLKRPFCKTHTERGRTLRVSRLVYSVVRLRAFSSSMPLARLHIWVIVAGQLMSRERCSRSG